MLSATVCSAPRTLYASCHLLLGCCVRGFASPSGSGPCMVTPFCDSTFEVFIFHEQSGRSRDACCNLKVLGLRSADQRIPNTSGWWKLLWKDTRAELKAQPAAPVMVMSGSDYKHPSTKQKEAVSVEKPPDFKRAPVQRSGGDLHSAGGRLSIFGIWCSAWPLQDSRLIILNPVRAVISGSSSALHPLGFPAALYYNLMSRQ